MPHVKEKRLSHTQKEPSGTRDGCRSGLGPHVCNLGLRTRRLGGKPAVIVNAIAEGHLHVPLRQLDKVGLFGRRTIIWVRRETPGYGCKWVVASTITTFLRQGLASANPRNRALHAHCWKITRLVVPPLPFKVSLGPTLRLRRARQRPWWGEKPPTACESGGWGVSSNTYQ